MATKFSDVFRIFLGKVDDYELALIDDVELAEILKGYLDTARSMYFDTCKQDIDTIKIVEEPTEEISDTVEENDDFSLTYINDNDIINSDTDTSEESDVTDVTDDTDTSEESDITDVTDVADTSEESDDSNVSIDIETPVTEDADSAEDSLEEITPKEEEPQDWEFTVDLTQQEMEILALCMVKAWLSPKLRSADLMSKDVGDRDYKGVQGYNYLEKLNKLNNETNKEIREATIAYSFKGFDMGDW